MACYVNYMKNETIPNLSDWFVSAKINEKGRCVVPPALARQCELSYAMDHDLSALRYVKRHIRLNSFGYDGGHFHDAYSTVKKNKAFSHELIHIWLNIWGTTDAYVPMLYEPFYDGNEHAEAMVVPMQDYILDKIIDGERGEPIYSIYAAAANWKHQSHISRGQKIRNWAALELIRSGGKVSVYDFMRANKVTQQYATPGELETKFGEKLIDPMDAKALSVPEDALKSFFDSCLPLIESVALTIDDLHGKISKDNLVLSPRTIDVMFRTLKVTEFHDIMHSGKPRIMNVSHVDLLKKIERNWLLDKYDGAIVQERKKRAVYTP